MNSNPQNRNLSFNDIYLSAFLKAAGYQLEDATVDHVGRVTFHFWDTPEAQTAVKEYFNGNALVNPARLIEEFKTLRTLVYSITENKMKGINHAEGKYR